MWQMQETLRRGLMSHMRHRDAAWGDAVSYLGLAMAAWTLKSSGALSLPTVFAAMACMYALGVLVQAMQIGLARIDRGAVGVMLKDFWLAGRWVLLSNISVVAVSLSGMWAMAFFHGRVETADFYAMGNFMKLTNPVIIGMSGLIVPAAAHALHRHGRDAAQRIALKYAGVCFALLAPYYLLLMAFPSFAIRVAYGDDSHFLGSEFVLRMFVVGGMMVFLLTATTSFMNGIHRSRQTFIAQLAGAAGMLLVAVPLTIAYGVVGQVIGGPIAAAFHLGTLYWFLWRGHEEQRGFDVVSAEPTA
jgi:O-antigen/teichoic acid export membrane protein